MKQFEVALSRQPRRALSLLGLARAKAAAGDGDGAKIAYAAFAEAWSGADPERPELKEARTYLAGEPRKRVAVLD